MSEKDTGGPAYPSQALSADGTPARMLWEGMTLRDYFAINFDIDIDISIESAEKILGESCPKWQDDKIGNTIFWAKFEAKIRYIKADAMIQERNK